MPERPVLIVANHVTTYDAALVMYALPRPMRRHLAMAMSGEMLLDLRKGRNQGNAFLNLLAPAGYFLITALFNVFPLPQRTGFRRSFAHAAAAMDHGYHVLVFPEGRRSDDGRPQPFKSGSGLLWSELRSPALPVYLEGLGEMKAAGQPWFRSGKLSIHIGTLIEPPDALPLEEATRLLERAVFRSRPASRKLLFQEVGRLPEVAVEDKCARAVARARRCLALAKLRRQNAEIRLIPDRHHGANVVAIGNMKRRTCFVGSKPAI